MRVLVSIVKMVLGLSVCLVAESCVRWIKSWPSVGTFPPESQVGFALVMDRCFLGAVPVAGGVSGPSVLLSPAPATPRVVFRILFCDLVSLRFVCHRLVSVLFFGRMNGASQIGPSSSGP